MCSKSREWKCKRCLEPINILVPDDQRTFINDGGNLFCSKHCKNNYNAYIPLDISRGGKSSKFKKIDKKRKQTENSKKRPNAIFKCFLCDRETKIMTHDKLCSCCSQRISKENQLRIANGEFLHLVGGLTNEQRSLIRLSKIN